MEEPEEGKPITIPPSTAEGEVSKGESREADDAESVVALADGGDEVILVEEGATAELTNEASTNAPQPGDASHGNGNTPDQRTDGGSEAAQKGGQGAVPWSNYMAYSNERISVKISYTWTEKALTAELRMKRGTRLSALIDKLLTAKSAPWNKWTAPANYFLVHKGTLLDNKRVVGDYSIDIQVSMDLVFTLEHAEALIKATRGKHENYRPPHRDMLEDKLKKWEVQGAATASRRWSASDNSASTPPQLSSTLTSAPRRTSVVSVVLGDGGSTVMAPTGVLLSHSQQLAPIALSQSQQYETMRSETISSGSTITLPSSTARRGSSGVSAIPEQVPKTLERVKVIVEFNMPAGKPAYNHEQIVTRGSRLDDVVHTIKSKSFATTYNDKCKLIYKGQEIDPRRTVADYCSNEKVMRCLVGRDPEQIDALKKQTTEEGYRPPYEILIEERRKAREASALEAAEKMRAGLPSPREGRSGSTTVTITVTTVPIAEQGATTRRTSLAETSSRRQSVGEQGTTGGGTRRSSAGPSSSQQQQQQSQSRRFSKGLATTGVTGAGGRAGEEEHLPPLV